MPKGIRGEAAERSFMRSIGLIQPKLGEKMVLFSAAKGREAISAILAEIEGMTESNVDDPLGPSLLHLGVRQCFLYSGAVWNSNVNQLGTYCLISPKGIRSIGLIKKVTDVLQRAGAAEMPKET